jgi:hypothetical protein
MLEFRKSPCANFGVKVENISRIELTCSPFSAQRCI